MATFNILHLTDLHYGLENQDSLFPSVRADFFNDLEKLHGWIGSFDLVLFSGDLTQRGRAEEYQGLNKLLDELLRRLKTYGSSDPIFLAVPGDHDLVRPADPDQPEVLILKDLAETPNREKVWNDLMNPNQAGRYRQVIEESFQGYQSWWKDWQLRSKGRKDFNLHGGLMPGDFSAVLEKEGARLGVVGLNTTFLQLTADDYEGKLAIDSRQFIEACDGKGDAWFEENLDACVLMTHQPPDWLAPANRTDVFEALIDREGRFAAHFCGHMHVGMAETRSLGWSRARRLLLGGSLFGLETDRKKKVERIHAYAACRIELPDGAQRGTIRVWPRLAVRRASNTVQFDRDQSFTPDPRLRDEGTGPQDFERLRQTSSPKVGDDRKDLEVIILPVPASPRRPDVGRAPMLDSGAQFRRHFIGRENLLRDLDDALDGLLSRSGQRTSVRLGRGGEVQIVWLHGFGGMGKSWFLRKACIEAESRDRPPKVALIDWHLPDWHQPANTPPNNPRELFNAIAYRLAHLYGVEKLDSYWEAERKVADSWERHRQLHDELDEALLLLQSYGPNWLQSFIPQVTPNALLSGGSGTTFKRIRLLEQLLRDRKEWSDNPEKLAEVLKQYRACQLRFDNADGGLFESWAEELGRDNDSVERPCGLLSDTLRNCIRSLSTSDTPLMLVLDTCELLSAALHSWLRRLLYPLLDGRTPLLVLVGSRQSPDPYKRPGDRGGWQDSVDATRLRITPFNEDVRFTVGELDEALARAAAARPDRPLPDDFELANVLHRVTLGVPLAFGTLLGLHWGEPPDTVLFELTSLDWNSGDEIDQNRAVRKVTEVVAGRFLLHLENRTEVADELRDITALALLRRANVDTLGYFWGTADSTYRLRELAQRYALLSDGDLHPTVREYLRRHWHKEPPVRIKQIAQSLLDALEQTRPEDEAADEPLRHDWELERLNILAWLHMEDAYPDFIRTLVTFMAAGQDLSELLEIALEIRPARMRGKNIRKMLADPVWDRWGSTWGRHDTLEAVSWLEKQRTSNWTDREQASLDLVAALALTENDRYAEAVTRFVRALEVFGDAVPEPYTVARSYFTAVDKLGQSESVIPVAESARAWAARLGLIPIEEWNESYYWILHNARQYEEAEKYCRGIIEADPDDERPRNFLSHILGAHLGKYEEAEQTLLAGLANRDESENFHYFYAQLLETRPDKLSEAEKAYRRTLEIMEKKRYFNKEETAAVLVRLGMVLERLNLTEEVRKVWQDVLVNTPDDADTLNSLAWNIYLTGENLDEAERLIRRSVSLAPDDQNALHTLAAILIRRGAWAEATPIFKTWFTQKSGEDFIQSWKDYRPQFSDAVKQGYGTQMAELMDGRNDEAIWPLMSAVLRALAEGRREFSELPEQLRDAAIKLCDQILSEEEKPVFPEV